MNFEAPLGCGTALVTPFRTNGEIDEPALAALVTWQVQSGISLLIPCGTTGEAVTIALPGGLSGAFNSGTQRTQGIEVAILKGDPSRNGFSALPPW